MKKATPEVIAAAVRHMGTCKYFPSGQPERDQIMELIDALADGKNEEQANARVAWLAKTMVNYVGEWQGPAQLRALYATQYRPADGDEGPYCTIAGFTPQDSERGALEGHERVKQLEDGVRDHERIKGLLN